MLQPDLCDLLHGETISLLAPNGGLSISQGPKAWLAAKACFDLFSNDIFHAEINVKAKRQCFEHRSSRENEEGSLQYWRNRRDLIHSNLSCDGYDVYVLQYFSGY